MSGKPVRTGAAAWVLIALLGILGGGDSPAEAQETITDNDCAMCHSEVDPDVPRVTTEDLDPSVHAGMDCVECHADILELPHEDQLARVECGSCHEDEGVGLVRHGRGLVAENPDLPRCADCHGSHNILPADDADSWVNGDRLPGTCGTCHSDINRVGDYGFRTKDPIAFYEHSVHGNGGTSAENVHASCIDCHGTSGHQILGRLDPESSTSALHIPGTCGNCHEEVEAEYWDGIHGQLLADGDPHAPNCTDCHGEHGILAHQDPRSSVNPALLAEATCTPCHESARLNAVYGVPAGQVTSFIDSFHGFKSRAGDPTVANCASCHGAHRILPSKDSRSSVHADNLQTTCGRCHEGIAAEFASTPIHSHDFVENRWTTLVTRIYLVLIAVVIGGMLIFILLDYLRHARALRRLPQIQRMDRNALLQHTLLMTSFIVLTMTGFALRYSEAWVFRILFGWIGGSVFRGDLHRVAAVVFMFTVVWHLVYLAGISGRLFLKGMAPGLRDVREFMQATAQNLGLREKGPAMGRFSFVEKAEYWALVWGSAVMIGTGIFIWFDGMALSIFSIGWLEVFRAIHLYEAWLAALAIVVWHFYWTVLRPGVYPGNPSWITGNMPREMYEEEHPGDPDPKPVPEEKP